MAERPTWDETWLTIADTIGKRSRCSRAGIGAVIVDAKNRICATGYNGPASNLMVGGECINWCDRAKGQAPLDNMYDACPSIHAEANALLYVDRSAVEGGTIYVTSAPCMQCAKLISNSGLRQAVVRIKDSDAHRKPEVVLDYLLRCGITVFVVKDNNDNRTWRYQAGAGK
jgi:dCMP deaminase